MTDWLVHNMAYNAVDILGVILIVALFITATLILIKLGKLLKKSHRQRI